VHTKVTERRRLQIFSAETAQLLAPKYADTKESSRRLEIVNVLIRLAVAADSPQLVELLCLQMAEHKLPFSAGEIAAAVAQTFAAPALGRFLVADETDSRLAGLAYVAFLHSMEHAATIGLLEELYVRAELRGRRIGSALLQRVIEEFANASGKPIELEIDASHREVESFYRKHGFAQRDRTRWIYRPPLR